MKPVHEPSARRIPILSAILKKILCSYFTQLIDTELKVRSKGRNEQIVGAKGGVICFAPRQSVNTVRFLFCVYQI